MWTTQPWVRVTGTGDCELDVPPWLRDGAREEAAAQERERIALGDPDDPTSLAYDLMLQELLESWTDLVGTEADEAVAKARSGPLPDELLTAGLGRATSGLGQVAAALAEPDRIATAGLTGALESLAGLEVQVQAQTYAVARQAWARGLHHQHGFNLPDWLARAMPWADRALLTQVTAVARACDHLLNQPVGTAVAAGRVPVRRAVIILDALGKVRNVIDPDQYEAYVAILLTAAADAALPDAHLRRAARTMLELVLEDEEKDKRERAANEQRTVRTQRRGNGMVRYIVDAPERQAAVLEGMFNSRLAAPQKGPDGELDPRGAGMRRFDALMSIVGRGLACPTGTPQMVRATLFVTMSLSDLRRDTPGHGTTLTGDLLSARQVRQAACEAEIIPVVLGGQSQILDYGRAKRLATPEQVKALYLRDGGCTFPGCTVPAQWTIAHHDPWYSQGGATDLDKLALLCEQHHTHVHEHDLECTIDEAGVTWHV